MKNIAEVLCPLVIITFAVVGIIHSAEGNWNLAGIDLFLVLLNIFIYQYAKDDE
jgi:hypothetical protein